MKLWLDWSRWILKNEKEKLQRAIENMATQVVGDLLDNSIIGLGSGSAVAAFVRKLGERAHDEGLVFSVLPSSLQIQLVAEQAGLRLLPQNMIPEIDVTIDGADQIDEKFNMIKGGGGALYRERILIRAAKKSIILADESKYNKQLSKSIPVETSFFARTFVSRELKKMGGKTNLRMLEKGYPFVTENCNIILDVNFGVIEKPEILQTGIKNIPGVIDLGIFVGEGNIFYRANLNGSVHNFKVR